MALLQAWTDIDWTDQVLHALAGGAIVMVLTVWLPWWAGAIISLAVALAREQYQHPGVCHAGCRTDLLFWVTGISLGLLGMNLIS